MSTIFIGGSRHVSKLPAHILSRLENIIEAKHEVIIGDANGADKSVQNYFSNMNYDKVTIYCSGAKPRNNIGNWKTLNIYPENITKGFQFYAAKDREMAKSADYGLMIWDGKSPGTILNVLRLLLGNKKAVLANTKKDTLINFVSLAQWGDFLKSCDPQLIADLESRATPEELLMVIQNPINHDLFEENLDTPADVKNPKNINFSEQLDSKLAEPNLDLINAALEERNLPCFLELIGQAAKSKGMTLVSQETGLARESLYRSLGSAGQPEFDSILKVISSLGYKLILKQVEPSTCKDSETVAG
ncbi:putative addiction module antidote protein [Pseudomonas sp. CBMAI 2609]|uniref:Addiction module antidote protein n=1 Tax=Pseudomonas flavocrustae TaxID=2991719 RepID=A0ABT6IEW2_9PSED|nr:addiction module antidote protein [Pseudomonas sp. CBMAI 2609]MDH4763044.1 putative addiction module antidote protein [Pseudomonas sp. CBMAI 2609]